MALKGKEAVVRSLRQKTDRFVRALTLEATRRVVLRTPVRTGRARNNWNVGRGSPTLQNVPEGNYPESGSQALGRARSVIARLQAGDTVWITNALAYIPALEGGHSKQAPAGMIAVTVAELQPLVERIAAEVRRGG